MHLLSDGSKTVIKQGRSFLCYTMQRTLSWGWVYGRVPLLFERFLLMKGGLYEKQCYLWQNLVISFFFLGGGRDGLQMAPHQCWYHWQTRLSHKSMLSLALAKML